MNLILVNLAKEYLPYLLAFLLGVVLTWKGCGNISGKPVTTIIEKPIPTIEYVDRWKTDTVRFVSRHVVTVHDTAHVTIHDIRVDTLFMVDTVSIVEAWLTEIAKYDTLIDQKNASIQLNWQNYQNRSENLKVTYTPKKVVGANFALGVHGNVGLISDFKSSYVPLMGLGVQATVKKTYFSADYGFNGQHYVGIRVGRNFISR